MCYECNGENVEDEPENYDKNNLLKCPNCGAIVG